MKPLIAFLDVTKAYDKAWMQAILYTLHKSGIKGQDWRIIKRLNENLTAKIDTKYGPTRSIKIRDSIRQGGILAVPQHANMMDEITKEISKNPHNFIKCGNIKIPGCLLWMDDVLLMHTEPASLQRMLDTTHKIASKYRIKFGTEKSKIIQVNTKQNLMINFKLGGQNMENTDTYKYLGITFNNKGNMSDHIKNLEGKAEAATQAIINISANNTLKKLQLPTTWKLHKTCLLPMITYSTESLNLTKKELTKLEGIRTTALKRYLITPKSTPDIAILSETASLPIQTKIEEKTIMYYHKKRSQNNHTFLEETKWHTNLQNILKKHDITTEQLTNKPTKQIRTMVKHKLKHSHMKQLEMRNQNRSKTKNILLQRNKQNILTKPKYMNTLSRNKCSAIFKYKSKMIDVKANYPGRYKDNRCRFCGEENETQEHIFRECKELTDLTNKIDTEQLNANDNMNYLNEAKIIQQIIHKLEENKPPRAKNKDPKT